MTMTACPVEADGQDTQRSGWRWGALAAAIALLVAGCAASIDKRAMTVDDYFAAWTDAWSSGDPYETIRFYDESVIAFEQPDDALRLPSGSTGAATAGEGRSWLAAWIPRYSWHEREIDDVFLFRDGAAVVHTITEEATASLTLMTLSDSKITLQSVLRWRGVRPNGQQLPSSAMVEDVVARHLLAWSGGDRSEIEGLYTDDAVIDLHEFPELSGERSLDDVVESGAGSLPGATVASLIAGERSGEAIFVVPGPYSQYVVFVAESDADGCPGSTVVVLEMSDGLIKTEDRGPSLDRVRACTPEFFDTHQWWADLVVPPPVEEQVSGQMIQADGSTIDVINGSPQLERFLAGGLERYSTSGLEAPLIGSVTFAPVPACENRDGIVFANDSGHPDLVICKNEVEVCDPSPDDCATFRRQPRQSVLHELAHVWLLANEDELKQREFMSLMGSATWHDSNTRWFERGVEQAAEIIAWGLMDEPTTAGRIGNPPCETMMDGFRILTGIEPPNQCR